MTTAMTAAAPRPEQTFCLHGLRVDLPAHRVCRGRQEITLTPQEYALLEALVVNHDLAMTREQLLETAWGYDYMGETNVVDVYVRYIRQKTADNVITTIRGVGYMIKTE